MVARDDRRGRHAPAASGRHQITMSGILVLFALAQAPIVPVLAHASVQQPPATQALAPVVSEMRELNEAESAALPPGEGRDAVALMCVSCHGVLPAVALRKTALAWV